MRKFRIKDRAENRFTLHGRRRLIHEKMTAVRAYPSISFLSAETPQRFRYTNIGKVFGRGYDRVFGAEITVAGSDPVVMIGSKAGDRAFLMAFSRWQAIPVQPIWFIVTRTHSYS